ncbi:MAG: hypothetical protein H6767_03070 [Candidatus Peribacteria bacterium]|nr:MAG: hypothetical protein H6767_03070 [Candidatus Peribacteria bacterium]
MELQVKIHVGKDVEASKEVVERLVEENLRTKLDHYLNKFKKSDAEGIIDLKIEKNKKGLFDCTLQGNLDGNTYRYSREDYKNMDDVINHLFDHFKEELSDK